MRHKIAGKNYKIVIDARLKDAHGICTDPARPRPTIKVTRGLSEAVFLETVLHEALHASAYQLLSEGFVSECAADLAGLLLKLGYSRNV